MNSNWTKLEGNNGELIVDIEGSEWTGACDKALNKLAKQVRIDGFRAGKAPKALVKKMVGKAAIWNEAVNIAFSNEKFMEVIAEKEIMPITQPQLSIEEIDDTHAKLKVAIEVRPEVELGQYKGFGITKDEVSVTDEEVANRIEDLRKQNAEWTVKEGTVENGDTATIDYEGSVDGVPFDGGKDESYALVIGSGNFIPGFEEQVIGMAVEETKDITVTFPADYHAENLAGKEAVFKVTVHEIKSQELPELNEEFVADCEIKGVTTMDELTAHIKDELTENKEKEAENKYDQELFQAVLDANPVEVPEAMIEEELQQMVQEMSQNLQQNGIDFDTYKQITGQTTEQIKEGLKDQAADRVQFNLIVQAVIKAEGLTVTDEEVEAKYAEFVPEYGETVEDVKKMMAGYETYLRSEILHNKAVEIMKGE